MSITNRSLAGLALSVLIALTSVTMAVARGQMRDATGTIVLCTGTGPVAVQVDANGEPVGPAHICPDCAISAFDSLGRTLDMPVPAFSARTLTFTVLKVTGAGVSDVVQRARDPPLTQI